MKVLYCNPSFWEYRLPFYVELNRLFKGNFHVIYSTKRYGTAHSKLLKDIKERLGENAHPYDNELMYDVYTKSFNKYTEGYKQIPFPFGLWKRISEVNPDVLITEAFFQWTPLVQLWGIFHNVPVMVGYERTLWTERNNSKLKTLIRRIQDKFIRGYLVNGQETVNYLKSIGISEDKIYIGGMSADSMGLRNGINRLTQTDKDNFSRVLFSDQPKGLVYLFSGRVSVLKGADLLLAAWESHIKVHPEDHIVLIGYGDVSEAMAKKYKDYSSVHLMGRVDYSEVHKYYAIANVFVLPTLTDNWSLVIPEAMACGLPVSTSIYNGCHPELVREGENGCTFDTFDNESIVRALDYFHHVDLSSFGKRSIEIEKGYNTEACAKREFDGIMKLVAKK